MKLAFKVADPKDDAHYQYAQMIFQKNIYQSDKPYEPWTLDLALQESKAAYAINPQPSITSNRLRFCMPSKKVRCSLRHCIWNWPRLIC